MPLSPNDPLFKLESAIKQVLPNLQFELHPGTTKLISTRNANGPPLETLNAGNTLEQGHFGLINSEDIGGADVEKILPCLQKDNQITSLLANNSYIDDTGAILLANFLRINTSLRVLDLHFSQISEDGLLAIVDALKSNDSLEYLNIRANKITDKVLNSLCLTLKQDNTCLRQIELTQNRDPSEQALNKDLLKKVYDQLPINLVARQREAQEKQTALAGIAAESQQDGILATNLPKDVINIVSSYFRPPAKPSANAPTEEPPQTPKL